jgi:hypothetical protein
MAASPDTLAGRFKDDALLHQFRSNMAADERKHGKGSSIGTSFSGRTNVRASSSSHSSRKERSPDNKAESSVAPCSRTGASTAPSPAEASEAIADMRGSPSRRPA